MTMAMPHMPKRVTQHGLFVPSSETEPPTLKPGQTDIHRRGMYVLEARNAFAATSYLEYQQPNRSEYRHSHKTQPEHYLRQTDNVGSRWKVGGTTLQEVQSGAAHWGSEYRSTAEVGAAAETREIARGKPRTAPARPRGLIGRTEDSSAYHDNYGKYGSNPRDLIEAHHTKLPVQQTDHVAGTTRASEHIPGYRGFIPANPRGPEAARVARGEQTRKLDKSNIEEIFHRNTVGYKGHEPASFRNDFGGRQHTELTTYGRDFTGALTAR